MKIIKSSDLNWILNKEEDVWIGLNSKLEPDSRLGISHAKLEPNQELKTHYHNRPDNGHEVFFFYQNGKIILKTKQGEKEIEINEPIYLMFKTREEHGIKNIGQKPIEFQLIYVPKFQEGEVYLKE